MKKVIPLFIFLGILYSLPAQIVINEFSASNKDAFFDNYNDNEDWIELYNTSTEEINLEGYHLSDKIDNPTKWSFPSGVTIPAGKHLLIFASDRDEYVNGFLHTNFKLTQMRQEHIILADPSGQILDMIQMTEPTQKNHSRGRAADGAAEWNIFDSPTPNDDNTGGFVDYAPKVNMSQPSGFYYPNAGITVAFEVPEGTDVHYTTDGSLPRETDPIYTEPLHLTSTTLLRARAYSIASFILPGFVESNTYFINENFSYPVISVGSEGFQELFGGDPFGGGNEDDVYSSFEFFDEQQFQFEMDGDFRSHGNDSWQFDQKGIRFYVRDQYGWANKIDYQLFPTSERTDFDVVIIRAAGSDNYPFAQLDWGAPGCHLRDAYAQTLAEANDLNLDYRRYRRCILFLNGQYWGIYSMRERVDSDYTNYYYDQSERWVDMLEYWGGLDVRYGSANEWYNLTNFIQTQDMSNPDNYAFVASELDINSFIDYFILNTFLVNTDWLNWNTKWWRGRNDPIVKWHYSLWDMDNIYDLGQNYTNLPTTTADADPCVEDAPNIGLGDDNAQDQLGTFASLFDNPDFVQAYINRYADLASTTFSCESMLGHFDAMVAELEPEMPRQIDRWGGSMSEWQENLEHMRSQIEAKCSIIADQVVDCYEDEGISGPYELVINVEPPLGGQVQINTAVGQNYPWVATYFGGTEISLKALPAPNNSFHHWEVGNHAFSPNEFSEAISLSLESGDEITAFFTGFIPCIEPFGLVVDSTMTSAQLSWAGASDAISYEVRYRLNNSGEDWQVLSSLEATTTLNGLDMCSAYDLEIRTICSTSLSAYSSFSFQTACANNTEETALVVQEINAYPNPFLDQITLDIVLAKKENIILEINDLTGKLVKKINAGTLGQGQHRLQFSGENLTSGIYLLQLYSEYYPLEQIKLIKR